MSDLRSRFVLACQQAIALAAVAAVAVSAATVVSLDIVAPAGPVSSANRVTPAAVTPGQAVVAAPRAGRPIRPVVREVPLDGIDRRGLRALAGESETVVTGAGVLSAPSRLSVLSAPEPVRGYATVGITWAPSGLAWGRDRLAIELRTRSRGVWSTWQPVQNDPEHEADPEELAAVRDGTDPVVVGDVDDVQVRATTADGRTPGDMSLSLVNPGGPDQGGDPASPSTAGDTGGADPASAPAGAVLAAATTGVPRPTILTRAQWRADERMRDPKSLRYGTIKAGFVHHTVNANSYSRGQVPAIIRGIYAYHTQSRGWSDIGYNFLVDRFGRIWEGRYGGVARPVVGAHTLGYNEYSFAMSAIGNFETARPTAAMVDAYARLFAWKLSLAGVSATATRQKLGSHYFKAISGHRDAGSTACPGRYLYARLGDIRTSAARYQRSGMAGIVPAPRTNLSGSAWPDLVVRDAATKEVRVVRTGGQLRFGPRSVAARGIGTGSRVVAGDLTGDGRQDLLVRGPRTRVTRLYRGTAAETFARTRLTTDRFAHITLLTGVGDWNGDGKDDVVGRGRRGTLWLYRGRDDGSFAVARRLARHASGYGLLAGVGDFDGDGRADLVARVRATLYLLPGRADGLGPRVALPGRWSGFDVIAGRGDATRDGAPDLLARARSSGRTYVFPGTGDGGLGHWLGPYERFAGYTRMALAPVTRGGGADVVAWARRTGRVSVVANNDAVNLGAVVDTGLTLPSANLLLNVGDWDGDGRGDIMTRSGQSGAVYLRRGLGGAKFARPVRMARGWAGVRRLAPVGDVTGDGRPDLAGRSKGATRVYPGNGLAGFGPSYVVASAGWVSSPPSAAASMSWVVGIGDLDGNGRAQDLLLRSPAGNLWLLPATSTGYAEARFVGSGFGGYDLAG